MTTTRHVPTAEDAMEALRAHVTECVRFPTRIRFDGSDLLPGEFAHASCRGESLSDGFDLLIHPHFVGREQDLPLLAAYHVVAINWLDVATHEEAELYGAALLGMELDEYYQRLCALADEVGARSLTDLHVPGWEELGEPEPEPEPAPTSGGCGGGGGGEGCACKGGA
jgi:hypothetical protein